MTPQVTEALTVVDRLTVTERLLVARYLLDSVLTKGGGEDNEKQSTTQLRPFGLCAGEFVVPADFDAPLPTEILKTFEDE